MPQTPEVAKGNGDSIIVGTSGTISSLMSRELESMKHSPRASSSSRRKLQTTPVSVPCSSTPKRTQLRKNPPNDSGNSSSSDNNSNSGNSGIRSPGDCQKPKPKPRRNGHRAPMLGPFDEATIENTSREKLENKKRHTYIVEVVDQKCNTPMSSRLKKLGFSKLSESFA